MGFGTIAKSQIMKLRSACATHLNSQIWNSRLPKLFRHRTPRIAVHSASVTHFVEVVFIPDRYLFPSFTYPYCPFPNLRSSIVTPLAIHAFAHLSAFLSHSSVSCYHCNLCSIAWLIFAHHLSGPVHFHCTYHNNFHHNPLFSSLIAMQCALSLSDTRIRG